MIHNQKILFSFGFWLLAFGFLLYTGYQQNELRTIEDGDAHPRLFVYILIAKLLILKQSR